MEELSMNNDMYTSATTWMITYQGVRYKYEGYHDDISIYYKDSGIDQERLYNDVLQLFVDKNIITIFDIYDYDMTIDF